MLKCMRLIVNCLLVVTLALGLGCRNEESSAPPPPATGGSAATGASTGDGGMIPRPPRDSGMGEDEDGGGDPTDGGDPADGGGEPIDGGVLPIECREVPIVRLPDQELGPEVEASTTSPLDFNVSRLVGVWEGDCDAAVFRVELSGGECPDGNGHRLTFLIDAAAIRDGNIRLGLNLILPEPNETGVRIRYVRPDGTEPEGEWGTCTDATGMLDLLDDAPSTEALSTLRARFSLDLTACGDMTAALQTVRGSFKVVMRRGLEDICPTM
jgi:hypothetical protein